MREAPTAPALSRSLVRGPVRRPRRSSHDYRHDRRHYHPLQSPATFWQLSRPGGDSRSHPALQRRRRRRRRQGAGARDRVAGDKVALALRFVVRPAHPHSTECPADLDAIDRAAERAPPKVHARRATESGGSRWAGGRAPARAARDEQARARAGVDLPRTRSDDEPELGATPRRVFWRWQRAGAARAGVRQVDRVVHWSARRVAPARCSAAPSRCSAAPSAHRSTNRAAGSSRTSARQIARKLSAAAAGGRRDGRRQARRRARRRLVRVPQRRRGWSGDTRRAPAAARPADVGGWRRSGSTTSFRHLPPEVISRRSALDSVFRVGRVSLVCSSGGIGVSAEALARSTCYAYVLYTMVLSSRGIGARLRRQIANQ